MRRHEPSSVRKETTRSSSERNCASSASRPCSTDPAADSSRWSQMACSLRNTRHQRRPTPNESRVSADSQTSIGAVVGAVYSYCPSRCKAADHARHCSRYGSPTRSVASEASPRSGTSLAERTTSRKDRRRWQASSSSAWRRTRPSAAPPGWRGRLRIPGCRRPRRLLAVG